MISRVAFRIFRKIARNFLGKFNIAIARKSFYLNHIHRSEALFLNHRDGFDLRFIQALFKHELKGVNAILENLHFSQSQLRQDLLVLWLLDFKQNGIFVEFGATDGLDLSNTFLLEERFGWDGVLAEPARIWHRDLKQNRRAKIDFRAISNVDNSLVQFFESSDARFSTYLRKESLEYAESYVVETVKLESLLKDHSLDQVIDYLSIDTEGTEYEILEVFNFKKYFFRVITVEFSDEITRKKVISLLSSQGYMRVFEEISQFEDWFIHPEFVQF